MKKLREMRDVLLEAMGALDKAFSLLAENSATIWTESTGWDFWECAECGVLWTVPGESPEELGYKYCPGCGREIEGFEHYTLDDGFPEEE